MFEQLGRTFFSFKQNPFALPTFNVLPLFFLFCFFLSGRAVTINIFLVMCSSFKDSSELSGWKVLQERRSQVSNCLKLLSCFCWGQKVGASRC